MNNKNNIIDIGTDILQNDRLQEILSTYLTLGDHHTVDHVQRHLLSLPVLLPHELDQLLDDNDALIDVVHGLIKANRVLDTFVYFTRLHDNLTVLLYHHEVYTRALEVVPLYTTDTPAAAAAASSSSPHSMNAKASKDGENGSNAGQTGSDVAEQQSGVNSALSSSPPPSFYALNIISLYYIQKQMERANDLIVVFESAGLNVGNSEELKYHTEVHRNRGIFSPWRAKDATKPVFHTKPQLSFQEWRELVAREKLLYQNHPWYQDLISQTNGTDFASLARKQASGDGAT